MFMVEVLKMKAIRSLRHRLKAAKGQLTRLAWHVNGFGCMVARTSSSFLRVRQIVSYLAPMRWRFQVVRHKDITAVCVQCLER